MNSSEKTKGKHLKLNNCILECKRIVQCDQGTRSVNIESRQFTYDQVFDVDSVQQSVYDECAFGLVESVLKGYNGTIFAYGQTGCGKTHTMMGVP